MITGGVAAALVIVAALFTLPAPDQDARSAAPVVAVAAAIAQVAAPLAVPDTEKRGDSGQKVESLEAASPKAASPKSVSPKFAVSKAASKTASATAPPARSKPVAKATTKRGSACDLFIAAASWDEAFAACTTEAGAGNALAGRRLATMYLDGHGTSRNEQTATQWFMQAADNGDVESMYQYGVSLERGRGIRKDQSAALRWYTRAGDAGLAAAQYALGQAYEHGRLNAPKSRSLALDWYRKAAAQNFNDAASKVRDLSN